MANPYFTKTGYPADGAAGSSSLARAEFSLIEAAFDKFPDQTADRLARVNPAGDAIIASEFAPALLTNYTGSVVTFATPGDLNVVYVSANKLRYARFGPLVMLTFSIACSTFSHTTASGNLKVVGLPIPSLASDNEPYMGDCIVNGVNTTYTHLRWYNVSENEILISKMKSGSAAGFLQASEVPTASAKTFFGSLVYRAA